MSALIAFTFAFATASRVHADQVGILAKMFAASSQASPVDPIDEESRARMEAVVNHSVPEPINCWGTALWVMGFSEGLRPAEKDEMLARLGSSACRKLGIGEPVQRGDVGSIYNSDSGLKHTYIYLSSNEIFEKGSPEKEDYPKLTAIADKFGPNFDIKTGCKMMIKGSCAWGIVNYRCDADGARQLAARERDLSKSSFDRLHFLFRSLKAAEAHGSNAALNDALNRYLKETIHLVGSVDASAKPVGQEAWSGLLLFVSNMDIERISPENRSLFKSLYDRLSDAQESTPRQLDNFPLGGLTTPSR